MTAGELAREPEVSERTVTRDAQALSEAAGGPGEDGWTTVPLGAESEEVAHGQLRALGPEAEVLAPETLRALFAADARRLADLYAPPRTTPDTTQDATNPRPPRASPPPRHDA